MVGGMAVHKGYPVLRDAIHIAQLGNKASFTIIDSHLSSNSSPYQLNWGGCLVNFRPPVKFEEMVDFYSIHDVLIAPSIWPESFGLVTREALSQGLWVISSNIGALSEPVVNGHNGFVVEPNDSHSLASAMIKTCNKFPQ